MTTFERCFVADKKTHKEHTVPYYKLINRKDICEKILMEFGLDPKNSIILNGHVPVKIKDGESPVKGGGKLIVIDGGMSKAYQKQTGIAGYTFHIQFEISWRSRSTSRTVLFSRMVHRSSIRLLYRTVKTLDRRECS